MAGVLEMEFSGHGGGWTIVTDVIVSQASKQWHRGFPGVGVLDLVADVGTLHFSLDNGERNSAKLVGYYSPDHANLRSGFYLGIGVRYRIGTVVRFTGVLAAIEPVMGKHGPRTVSCEAVDWMDVAVRTRLSKLAVQTNKRGDEVFQILIDSLPIISQPDAVEKDTGSDIFPYTLDRTRDDQTLLRDEIYRLDVSGLDRTWVRGDGTVVWESRTRRAGSQTSTDIFTDSNGFVAKRDRTGVINRALATVHPRLVSLTVVVMYSLNQPTPVTPGLSLTILGPWTDPANPNVRVGAADLEPVVAITDYVVNSAADGSGLDLTANLVIVTGLSGNATQFDILLGGSTAGYLIKLQQRGKPLYDYGQTILPWEDAASIEQYGPVTQSIDMQYQANPNLGLEAAQYVVFSNAVPFTQISGFVRYVGFSDAAEIARSINRQISDRITLVESVTGISRAFFINAIDETEMDGVLKTEWLLAPADSTAFWLLEIVGRSELDTTTRLGFGLISGHTDIAHGDTHGDSVHQDIAHSDTHTDSPHQDVAHSDALIHGDSVHGDSHTDNVHSDSAHLDAHFDTTHQDTLHGDSHSDVDHSDTHTDTHTDYHGDEYP